MQKVIVFGIGKTYNLYRERIYKEYSVVGVTDNNYVSEDQKEIFVEPNSLPTHSDVKILVCIRDGYIDVFRQLMKSGFSREDIISINDIIQDVVIEKWLEGGSALPPPSEYKRKVIKDYASQYGCRKLIETGTYYGGTIESQLTNFDSIASVELSEELYNKAKVKFQNIESVHLYLGDSGKQLGRIIDDLDASENSIFWLDGHYSGGETACGEIETPIMKELSIIAQKCSSGVILIDDARCFTGKGGYPTIEELYGFMSDKFNVRQWENSFDIVRCVF